MRFIFTIFIGLVFSTSAFSKNHHWNLVNFSYGAKIYHSSKIIIKRNDQRQTYVVIDYLKPINKIYNSVLYKIDVDCKTKKINFSQKVQYTSRMANKRTANGKIAKKQPAKLDKKDFGKWYAFPGVNWWSLTADNVCNFDKIEAKKKQKIKKYNLTKKTIASKKSSTNNKSVSNTKKVAKKSNALSKKRIRELKRILSKEEFKQLEVLFGTKFIEEITLLDEKNWRAFINQIKKTAKTTQQIKKQSQKKQPQKKEFKKQEIKKQQINKQKIEKKSFKKEDEKKKEFKIEVEKKNTYKK